MSNINTQKKRTLAPGKFAVVLGNQLFDEPHFKKLGITSIYLAEDAGLCTHFKYHRHKLVLFLASMRRFARRMEKAGFDVHYEKLSREVMASDYESKLTHYLRKHSVKTVHTFEVEDKFMEGRLGRLFEGLGVEWMVHESPMFLTSRAVFAHYVKGSARPFMKTFYEMQRKRLNLLVDAQGKPEGGKWSFDVDNRLKLPKTLTPPALPDFVSNAEVTQICELVDSLFSDHPGTTSNFWLPTSREEAVAWLDIFLQERFHDFGKYEDALSQKYDFLFHSVLTPMLNLGLLTPAEVIKKTLAYRAKHQVPFNSVEGFIRQVIGWREFIRGIYQNFSEKQDTTNFWNHTRKLKPCWYDGTTGILPLDHVIKKAVRLGFCHHIERLMVVGNLMVLCEIAPPAAHAWFMELFVDSSDWVMGPNVYGMGIFSDGGIFATKPYLCASNYLLKMSDFKRGDWCDDVDALFWNFLGKHKTFFAKNPRLNMLLHSLQKRNPTEVAELNRRAEVVRNRLAFDKL
jgi:deoxyribodipyrimidine photolyase-related protein